jgi:hypothetical protein
MRGRKPEVLHLDAQDKPILERIARSQSLPWYQVRRARIVLAMAAGQRVQTVAFQMQCAPRTVHRTCGLYRREGLPGLLAAPRRTGRPSRFSPPAVCAVGAAGVFGTGSDGAAYYPVVES